MTNPEQPGPLRRLLTALGRALGGAILGRASPAHMRQFAAGDEYWEKVVAAQLGWPRELRARPGLTRSNTSRHTNQSSVPRYRRTSEPEYEPVHGWTKRQFDDVMARDPGCRPAYEAKLGQRRERAGMIASTRLWFGLWGPSRHTVAVRRNGCDAENARAAVQQPLRAGRWHPTNAEIPSG